MAENKATEVRLHLRLFLSTEKDSHAFQKQHDPSTCTSVCTSSTTFSPLYNPLTVEEEAKAIAQVKALRKLSDLLDEELTTVSVKEASQSKATVQLKSPIDSPFLKLRAKMRLSERSLEFRALNQ